MGIFNEEIWKCNSCGYEFVGESGLYEADPNDMDTTHAVDPYYCPKCHIVKNLVFSMSPNLPNEDNMHLIRNDSTTCEKCKTEMKELKRPKVTFLQIPHICPKCGKRNFVFVKIGDEIWT